MSVLLETPAGPPLATRRPRLPDLLAPAVYLLGAFLLYRPLWTNLGNGYLGGSGQDQNMWEWFFAVVAHSVAHGENPFGSVLQNYPAGVNLMANTAMTGASIPLTPVTLAFGPATTWALLLTTGLAGTAAAWYWVLSRHFLTSRTAAAVAGAFCGFAPPVISHASAHPNFAALFLFPFITLRLIRLARGESPLRNGVVLGLLVALQVLLGEEPLLIGAVTLAVFGLAQLAQRPRTTITTPRTFAAGLGVAAAVSALIVAFPLWWQFFGPQSYHALEHGPRGNDAAAFTTFAADSLAGNREAAAALSMNGTEQNAFFGWPLVLLLIPIIVVLRRSVAARALAITAFVLAWISTGSELVVAHHRTGLPGPWALLAKLPLFESVLESRFALGCVPVVGILLGLAIEHVLRVTSADDVWRAPARVVAASLLLVTLAPIVPAGFTAQEREQTPAFFTAGIWAGHVRPGHSLVNVPLPDTSDAVALHWQVDAGLGFPVAEGYFVGPNDLDGRGMYGAIRRPTSNLLKKVAETGAVPEIGLLQRFQAAEDLRFWNADVVVLGPHRNQVALKQTVEKLLGPAVSTGGVWVWDVRNGVRS
ncbi:glycosyl transferase [Amycolatopsis sp. H20-H5]|uniref:glycosyl transferase n=1 Tax=Amycolatopsis sp. H20-H5 TaxID=3046309 RepID=UPI002DBC8188|nr:glycosyl transferase [Amycolatopsis sp. H20-H5]MEC3982761.1 glycosyl transferase [Amycolatopsis sp. H20-H5]